ncbi:MAG: Trehalose synthase, partial [Verrucomicrobiaceae bacterium]|nr:Trehalose synthase [Verrucomicrobiaceae bacterium]
YGDEIGMGDNVFVGDRNGVRTPMQWSPDRNAGFSKANPQQLYLPTIIDPEYHYESVNVENQQKNLSSLYWWMRRLLKVRQQSSAFARGSIEFLHPVNAKILAYIRRFEQEVILVVANLSRFTQCAELDLSAFAGMVPVEMFGHTRFPEIKQTPTVMTLSSHAFNWFSLSTTAEASAATWTPHALPLQAEWSSSLLREIRRSILPAYLPLRRWFGGKGRVMREIEIVQNIPMGWGTARLLLIEAAFSEGTPESYLMPLAFARGEEAKRLMAEFPQVVLASFNDDQILCDALYLPEFRAHVLGLITSRHQETGPVRLTGNCAIDFDAAEMEKALVHTRVLSVEQSNTSIIYGDLWFLKFLRKYEQGRHPDVELTHFLTTSTTFSHVPAYAGALTLQTPGGEGVAAMLVRNVQHQGDGWTFTLDALARYFDRVLEAQAETPAPSEADVIGAIYPERARQLGQITAEMHMALADSTLPDFEPEAFSTLYQRSLYQSMRGGSLRVLRQLQQQRNELPEALAADAGILLDGYKELLGTFGRLFDHQIDALKIRVHGDFHLGQVLNTGKDFVIIDFEGEPRLALGDRRLKRPALWDVAGMLRSFDYAALAALRYEREDDAQRLEPWARVWVREISRHFLEAYFEKAAGAPFLPSNPVDTKILLDAFLLNKALYEIGYELSYRPDFLGIPLRAACRMLEEARAASLPPAEAGVPVIADPV